MFIKQTRRNAHDFQLEDSSISSQVQTLQLSIQPQQDSLLYALPADVKMQTLAQICSQIASFRPFTIWRQLLSSASRDPQYD